MLLRRVMNVPGVKPRPVEHERAEINVDRVIAVIGDEAATTLSAFGERCGQRLADEVARGLTERTFEDHTHQVPRHYGGIKKMLEARESELAGSAISDTYIANMKNGLQHWVDAGNAGHLAWGIMIFDNAQG